VTSDGRKKPFTTIFKDELSSDDDQASYDTQLSSAETIVSHGEGTSFAGNIHGRSASTPVHMTGENDRAYGSRRPLANFAPFHGASDSESEETESDLSSEDSDADDPVVILSRQRRMATKANKKRFMTIQR
jgi:hypothetical protein